MDLSYKLHSVRSAAILTGTYVAHTINMGDYVRDFNQINQLVILLDFTKGQLTTAEVKLEFSPDNTNWYQEVTESVSAGIITTTLAERQISATGKYRIPVAVKDRYIKISVKGTGTATGSSMAVKAITGMS